MHIIVNESKGKSIKLRLPSRLALNGLSAALLSKALNNQNIVIAAKQLRILFRAIKKYKIKHPKWKLVEIYSHDGTFVEITL